MSVDLKRAEAASDILRQGTVLAVCYSEQLIDGVGKEPRQSAQVTRWGIPGDRHYGETRTKSGRAIPNNRPITIFGVEAVRSTCEQLGIPTVAPGGFGEN